jgi:hypothetical protein
MVRVDKCTFTENFLTTDNGNVLYFSNATGTGLTHYAVPEGAYTGESLSSAIQSATGRSTFYNSLTNSITHTLASSNEPWLNDTQLSASYQFAVYPTGSSADTPQSLNAVLGDGTNSTTQVTWPFVRMSPYNYLFLRSNRLQYKNHHGPRHTHDILCSIPLTGGTGSQVEVSSPDGMYYSLVGSQTIRTIDLRLTDYLGRNVNLRGRPLALQLTFD